MLQSLQQSLDDFIAPLRSDRFCRLCGARPKEFAWSGLNLAVLQENEVVGGGWRPECACPHCRSSDRERLVYEFLRRKTEVFLRPQSVLHLAPEATLGAVLQESSCAHPYVTSDLSMKGVSVTSDLTALPFVSASFDLIICNHVLEHIKNEGAALSELRRVLKPKGIAVLQVPIALKNERTVDEPLTTELSPAEREAQFGQNDHVRLYGRDYPDRLRAAGFTVFVWNFATEHGQKLAHHLGIKDRENLYFVI